MGDLVGWGLASCVVNEGTLMYRVCGCMARLWCVCVCVVGVGVGWGLARREPSVAEHADGGSVVLGHETCHHVQTQPGHLLPVDLQDLVAHAQQPRVQLLCAAVDHLLHVHTYRI